MRYLLIVLLLLSALTISAQTTPCTTKIEELGTYKGLRLGMSQAKVESVIGDVIKLEPFLLKPFRYSSDNDEIKNIEVDVGLKTAKFYIPKNNTNENLKSITFIEFEFYNDYLKTFKVNYMPPTQPWESIKEYTDKISESLNLPSGVWRDMSFPSRPDKWAILRCDGFAGYASLQFPPSDVFIGFSISDSVKSDEMFKKAREVGEIIMREKESQKP